MKRLSNLILIAVLFYSCNKGNDDNGSNCMELVAKTTWPAFTNGSKNLYFFNADKTLAKTIYYSDSVTISRADTFYYGNGKLAKSCYSLNEIDFEAPYAYSEYDYINGRLSASRYFVKQSNLYSLYSNSTYVTDDSGRITVVNQYRNGNLQKNRFEYDANSNLTKVYIQFGAGGSESLYDEYFDYDSMPNPFYKMPFEFDHDMYLYAIARFAKHNYRRHTRGSYNETFQLSYYSEGNLKSIKDISNPFPASTERLFTWECK